MDLLFFVLLLEDPQENYEKKQEKKRELQVQEIAKRYKKKFLLKEWLLYDVL